MPINLEILLSKKYLINVFKIYYISYKKMNIKLLKNNWRKYYKRGFITGLVVLCFLCFVDQTLQFTIFFNKITSLGMFMLTLSYIFFGAVFCGIFSIIILVIMSLVTTFKN